jgi:hypothetical protein
LTGSRQDRPESGMLVAADTLEVGQTTEFELSDPSLPLRRCGRGRPPDERNHRPAVPVLADSRQSSDPLDDRTPIGMAGAGGHERPSRGPCGPAPGRSDGAETQRTSRGTLDCAERGFPRRLAPGQESGPAVGQLASLGSTTAVSTLDRPGGVRRTDGSATDGHRSRGTPALA